MTIGCNIWMICLKLNWFFYGLSRMLQFSQFVWTLRSSVWDVFNNFLLTDATDRSKICIDQKRFFIAFSLYPLSFFANTPFKNLRKLLVLILKQENLSIQGLVNILLNFQLNLRFNLRLNLRFNLSWCGFTL